MLHHAPLALRHRFGTSARSIGEGDRCVVIVDGKKRRATCKGEETIGGVRHLRLVLDPLDTVPAVDEVEEDGAEQPASAIAVPASDAKRLVRRHRPTT